MRIFSVRATTCNSTIAACFDMRIFSVRATTCNSTIAACIDIRIFSVRVTTCNSTIAACFDIRTVSFRITACNSTHADSCSISDTQRSSYVRVTVAILCVNGCVCTAFVAVTDRRNDNHIVFDFLRSIGKRCVIRNGHVKRVNHLRLRAERRNDLQSIRRSLNPVRGVKCNRQIRTVDRTFAALHQVACAAHVRSDELHAQAFKHLCG